MLHSVIDKVYRLRNLAQASRKVCANGGAPGVDKQTVKSWSANEEANLRQLHGELYADAYRSKEVLRQYIPKLGSKKMRPLGIPAVRDRVCQQAVLNVIGPTFEKMFHKGSYGFRPGRSCQTARKAIVEYRKAGYRYVVDLDIRNFFGEVDHNILMRQVKRVVKDRRVVGLLRGWLTGGVLEEGKIRYEASGTPQGGVVSPLLSNIYLTPFDHGLSAAGYEHVRYADDVLILCRSRQEAEAALATAAELLGKLKLMLSPEKTIISSFREGFDFLGFRFTQRHVQVASKSLKSLYAKVRERTRRQQGGVPVAQIITKVNDVIIGWATYHRHGSNVGLFRRLDKWVRNRIRAYVRRRWRDRGRWKVYSAIDLTRIGLKRMVSVMPNTRQLTLLKTPC